MKPRKARNWVKTFKPRFAPLVRAGKKKQTIRPMPARREDVPIPGDTIDCRMWTGRPYKSKQKKLRDYPEDITMTARVQLAEGGLYIGNRELSNSEREKFAKKDGFTSFREMQQWFWDTHELPFTGLLISWE